MVTRDVEPGEVIMVDEPFSIVLERILNWDEEHCSNCSRPVVSGLPCDCCTFVSLIILESFVTKFGHEFVGLVLLSSL